MFFVLNYIEMEKIAIKINMESKWFYDSQVVESLCFSNLIVQIGMAIGQV